MTLLGGQGQKWARPFGHETLKSDGLRSVDRDYSLKNRVLELLAKIFWLGCVSVFNTWCISM